jgi:hypothetical protein
VKKYLRTRSVHHQWALQGDEIPVKLSAVVVIPALAESQHLETTISALTQSSEAVLRQSLLICVVNNRRDPYSTPAAREDNERTLQMLDSWQKEGRFAPLSLARVDAASSGQELPDGEGVGLARKIGLDHGLVLLNARPASDTPSFLVSLDADSPPAPEYLDHLFSFYSMPGRHGGYAAYAHSLDADPAAAEAMIAYELYMRYHELHLRWAGSPYAWPALGSIISCTAPAYAAAGGMNRHCAGEDFYFMQQLCKTGALQPIAGARVHPSGRLSERAPFGTGPHLASGKTRRFLYHPGTYRLLKKWLALADERDLLHPERLPDIAETLSPALHAFLCSKNFFVNWRKIHAHHGRGTQLDRHFHSCFDGLRTIQWIHYSRDQGLEDLPAEEAFAVLQVRVGFPESLLGKGEELLLEGLREWMDR